jgi:hypothetical protein
VPEAGGEVADLDVLLARRDAALPAPHDRVRRLESRTLQHFIQ